MIKRIFLFLLTNILVLVLISFVLMILNIFGINVGGYFNGSNYISVLIYAGVIGFSGAFISLFLSKTIAKWSYDLIFINNENLKSFGKKEELIYKTISELSNKKGIKIPEVGIYESNEPNAFATGYSKNNSLIAVSSGLIENMNEDEIIGVIAHEFSHITSGDMVTMTLLQGVINTFVIFFSRVIASIADKFFSSNDEENSSGPSWIYYVVSIILEILFSILASIVVMAFSRYREYKADEGSSRYVGKQKMILALKKLKNLQNIMITDDSDKLATMKIGSKKRSGIFSLFSSHPDLEDRIKNLEEKNL